MTIDLHPAQGLADLSDTTDAADSQGWLREPAASVMTAVIQANAAPTSVKDGSRRYVAANTAFLELFGLRLADIRGRRDEDLLQAETAAAWMHRDRLVLETGEPISDVFDIRRPGQDALSIRGISQPVVCDGRAIGIATCLDAQAADREAWEARERRLLFQVGQLAHELRSPMAGVIGLVRLTRQEGTLPPVQQQRLDAIERCGLHLNSTLDDLVEIGLIGTASVTLRPHDVDLAQLLQDVADWARPLRCDGPIDIQIRLEGAAPGWTARLDGQRVRQVLLNLVSNAAKATQDGQVGLRCLVRHEPAAPGPRPDALPWLRFEVSDTGHGLSTEQLTRLLRDSHALELWKDTGGTRRGGIGLLICRRLVRSLGGELQVRSEAGQGTTFWFELPTRITQPSRPGAPAPAIC